MEIKLSITWTLEKIGYSKTVQVPSFSEITVNMIMEVPSILKQPMKMMLKNIEQFSEDVQD
jgi:hypothetical protein